MLPRIIKSRSEIVFRKISSCEGKYLLFFRVGNQSIVYTGDYNMTPDRHLGAAWIDKCRPDLLITGM